MATNPGHREASPHCPYGAFQCGMALTGLMEDAQVEGSATSPGGEPEAKMKATPTGIRRVVSVIPTFAGRGSFPL
ncbi:MAG: hypothetical protein OXI91_04110 [Chloroflexota bacterium]|nr:hypothetical protein [Chloroflexota bacterium]